MVAPETASKKASRKPSPEAIIGNDIRRGVNKNSPAVRTRASLGWIDEGARRRERRTPAASRRPETAA